MSVICDSYSEDNYSCSFPFLDNTWISCGQAFSGNGGKLETAQFYMYKTNNPAGNCYARIWNIMFVYGSSALPLYGSEPLAVSDPIDSSTLPDARELVTFTFSGENQITLGVTTKYCLTFDFVNENGSPDYVYVFADHIDPTHSGNICYRPPGMYWGYDADMDLCFYVYTDTPKFTDIISNNSIITAPI